MEEEKLVTDASFNTTDVSLRSTCRDRTLQSLDSHPIIKINSDSTCVLNSTCTHIA